MMRPLKWFSSWRQEWKAPLLSQSIVPAGLTDEVDRRSTACNLAVDRVLFRDGDQATSLYVLKKGEVTFTVQSSRQMVPCFRVAPRFLIGLSNVVCDKPYTLTAIASQDAEVTQFSADEFLKLIQNNPQFYFQALQILAAETDAAQTALAAMLSYWKMTE